MNRLQQRVSSRAGGTSHGADQNSGREPTAGAVDAIVVGPPAVMTAGDFLARVLPESGRGRYILFQNKRHSFFNNLDEIAAAIEQRKDTQGLYFATAAYGAEDNRTGANVVALRSYRIDVDAGAEKFAKHPDGAYPTQRDALDALIAFVQSTSLTPTLIVSSGEGLHVYWCLTESIAPADWKPVALQLNAAGAAHGLKIDAGCTADLARVLRPIGTLHKNGRRVELLQNTGAVYAPGDIAAKLAALAAADAMAPVSYDPSVNADVATKTRPDNRERDAGLIAKQCPMVGNFAAGKPVTEPVWRVILGVLKFCRDGERLWHGWSALDPRYDRAEAQRKWDLYQAGPSGCGAAPQCKTCKHGASLGTPVLLGDVPPDAAAKSAQDSVAALTAAVESGVLRPILDTAGVLNFVRVTETAGRRVRTVMPANSEAASDAIIATASASGKTPTDKTMETFKAQQRHGARQRGESVPVFLRVAEHGGTVHVDLGPGRIARIDAAGVKLVDDVAEGVPYFRRGTGAGQLPDPELFADARTALRFVLGVFVERFGLALEQALAVVATILDWHRTSTPHPVLEIVGPAGCGKSTVADFILGLIDPPGGGRVTVGTAAPDIAAAAQQRFVLPLDNAGRLDKATSDMLCIVSTGGSLLVRLLYTNGETANLMLHRPLIVTAVTAVCTAPDLQNRVGRIELQARRQGYAAESELRAGWDELRPKMLGALYTLLSGALRELPAVRARQAWSHRLVDFDQLGEAMVAAGGAKAGTFIKAIGGLRESMARRTASGDLFLVAMLEVLRTLAAKPTHSTQPSLNGVLQLRPALCVVGGDNGSFTVTARPGALRALLPLPALNTYSRDRGTPATDRGVIDALRRVQPLLASMGVDVSEVTSGTRTLLRFVFDPGRLLDA